jgi:hypothetical protein
MNYDRRFNEAPRPGIQPHINYGELYRLAIHEVSHSALARAFGVLPRRTWLEGNDAGALRGWSRTEDSHWQTAGKFPRLVYMLAGQAGDLLFCEREPNLKSADRMMARELALEIDSEDPDSAIHAAWDAALDIVGKHEHQIRTIADKLYQQGELNEAEFEQMFRELPRVEFEWPYYRSHKAHCENIRQIMREREQEWERHTERVRAIMQENEAKRSSTAPRDHSLDHPDPDVVYTTPGYFRGDLAASGTSSDWDRPRKSWADSRTLEYLRSMVRA